MSHLHHGDNRKPLLQTGGAEFDRCGCLLDMDGLMKDSADHSYFNLNRTDYMSNGSLSHISHTTLFSVLCFLSLYLWVLEKTKHLKM